MSGTEEGVTIVVTRTIKAGHEAACEAWLHEVAKVCARFPGHLGMTVFRPRAGTHDYTFVYHYDTEEHMQAWEKSAERAELLRRAEDFTETHVAQRLTGLETWFAHPDAPVFVPPRWKMVVVSFGAAFPLIQIFSRTVGKVPVHPLARGALVGMMMVLTMTYLAMPYATRLLRGWLYKRDR